MSETSATFSGWADRVTYVVANAQLVVLGLLVSVGAAIVWLRPSLPGVPPIVWGWLAALTLLGPPLLALFVTGVRKLRNRNMVPVHHINGVKDVREKYYVEPAVWEEKTVEGPAPYWCDESEVWEVREFEYHEDTGDLIVTGCYFSQLADSKLVTVKAMLEDIHGALVEEYLAANKLRGRISKMGLQIQKDVINEEAEADERGLMNPKTAVKKRFESARDDAEQNATDGIESIPNYVEDYADEHGIETAHGPPATLEQTQETATGGGTEP
ncbi:hypothetical protein [Halopiger goleimassiliensis]|uniref:hypothetical protein n=1 Tax=Halopiger goleimassiliensis TaxID=1293048 RepID=UPI0006781C8C|nr:hypothetical protein [Halopiger goleimassiliensis]